MLCDLNCKNLKCIGTGSCVDQVPEVEAPSVVPDATCPKCTMVTLPQQEIRPGVVDLVLRQHAVCNGSCKPPARTIIAFTGLAGSGKSTAAAHMVLSHNFERVRFAGPLKAMVAALGLTPEEIEGHLKETPCAKLTHRKFFHLMKRIDAAFGAIDIDLGDYDDADPIPALANRTAAFAYTSFIGVLTHVIAKGEADGGATPRLLMQMIGTEWGRDQISKTLWVDLWRRDVDALPAGKPVVIDDCRFANEAEAVQVAGGVLIRIVRPGAGAGAAGHSSEGQALPYALTIHNDGSVAGFLALVGTAVRDLSWIRIDQATA